MGSSFDSGTPKKVLIQINAGARHSHSYRLLLPFQKVISKVSGMKMLANHHSFHWYGSQEDVKESVLIMCMFKRVIVAFAGTNILRDYCFLSTFL